MTELTRQLRKKQRSENCPVLKPMKKSVLIILFIVCSFAHLHGNTITFPVSGLETVPDEPVPIDVEWNENWFSEGRPTEYHHGIARIAALLSEVAYVEVEKHPENNELLACYELLGFTRTSIEFHYELDYSDPVLGNNQAAFSFALKEIDTDAGKRNLLFAVIRGTPLSANEWISNLGISDSTKKDAEIHEGFFITMQSVKDSLVRFVRSHKIDLEKTFILITGHSRGAAIANLMGAELCGDNFFPGGRTFVYTFAAPNVTQRSDTGQQKYDFIWNIVNAEDIVPSVPPNRNNWRWNKFGRTLVLANNWNTDSAVFQNQYIPRINAYYNRLLLRDYAPFKNGPFLQIQVSRILTTLYKTPEQYYRPVLGLRKKSEAILWKIFPPETNGAAPKKKSGLASLMMWLETALESKMDGNFNYTLNAFIDMHACESYFSFLLALNESEAFSTVGSMQIILEGTYECAVYDDDGVMLARVLDGVLEFSTLRPPAAGIQLLGKTVLGFSGTKNLSVIIYKNSLIPTSVPYTVEYYNADGILQRKTKKQSFFSHSGMAITFNTGTYTNDTNEIERTKISKKESAELIDKYGLKHKSALRIQPEISVSTKKTTGISFRTGTQPLFGSIGAGFDFGVPTHGFSLSPGIGWQQSLYGSIMLDAELFYRFVWIFNSDDNAGFSSVPSARLSVSFKPLLKAKFFVATTFDFNIGNFSEHFFDEMERKNGCTILDCGSIGIIPNMQFGLRF